MPFKIPRLEVKFASQRCGSFTQDSSCSSSQFDLLGNNYCSQNSRDSAIDSSQPEKPDSGGFWTSLRGSVDNERRNSVATNPPIGNAAPVIKIVDDIWDTVTELDALITKFVAEPVSTNEINDSYSKLDETLKMLEMCSESAKGSFTQVDEMASRINSLRSTVKKALPSPNPSITPRIFYNSICSKSSLKLKIDSFTSNLDFMVKLARKRIESTEAYSSRFKKPHSVFVMSPRIQHLAVRRKLDSTPATHTSGTNTRRTASIAPFLSRNARTVLQPNASVRKTPEFAIKFCDKPATVTAPRKTDIKFERQCKPNVRCRQQSNLVHDHHMGVRETPLSSPIFSDRPRSGTQHLLLPADPVEDIFCDLAKERHDDDGFSSISDDCISLNDLFEVEE